MFSFHTREAHQQSAEIQDLIFWPVDLRTRMFLSMQFELCNEAKLAWLRSLRSNPRECDSKRRIKACSYAQLCVLRISGTLRVQGGENAPACLSLAGILPRSSVFLGFFLYFSVSKWSIYFLNVVYFASIRSSEWEPSEMQLANSISKVSFRWYSLKCWFLGIVVFIRQPVGSCYLVTSWFFFCAHAYFFLSV